MRPFTKKVQPLSQKFFSEMLSLEYQMSSKNYSFATIMELSDYYGKAIEYYNSVKDSISSYFLEKLQLTLQSRESLKVILQNNTSKNGVEPNKENISRSKHKQSNMNDLNSSGDSSNSRSNSCSRDSAFELDKDKCVCKQNKSSTKIFTGKLKNLENIPGFDRDKFRKKGLDIPDDDEEEDEVEFLKRTYNQNMNSNKTVSQLKLERSKSAYRYMKILEEKSQIQKTLTNYSERYLECAFINDKIIRKDISNQLENLRKKIEKKSFEKTGFINRDNSFNAKENICSVTLEELKEKLHTTSQTILSNYNLSPILANISCEALTVTNFNVPNSITDKSISCNDTIQLPNSIPKLLSREESFQSFTTNSTEDISLINRDESLSKLNNESSDKTLSDNDQAVEYYKAHSMNDISPALGLNETNLSNNANANTKIESEILGSSENLDKDSSVYSVDDIKLKLMALKRFKRIDSTKN